MEIAKNRNERSVESKTGNAMKNYLIIYNPDNNSAIINDRIKSLGEYYILKPNHFVVNSVLETAKEVYNSIVKTDFNNLTILVLAFEPVVGQNYWGVDKKELWDWLENHR